MDATASQTTSLMLVCSTIYSCVSKKTSKFRTTGPRAGSSPVTGEPPAQVTSNTEDASIWWRHRANRAGARQKSKVYKVLYWNLVRFSDVEAQNRLLIGWSLYISIDYTYHVA